MKISHKRTIITAGTTAVVIATAVSITIAITSGNHSKAAPVAFNNISRNYRVCMLSTAHDTAIATATWQEVQTAKRHATINAQKLQVTAYSTQNIEPYINSLVAENCNMIITTGNDTAAALATTARKNSTQDFINVGRTVLGKRITNISQSDLPILANILAADASASRAH